MLSNPAQTLYTTLRAREGMYVVSMRRLVKCQLVGTYVDKHAYILTGSLSSLSCLHPA